MPLATPKTTSPLCTLVRVSDKRIAMRARFGPSLPKVQDGYGGWKIIDRPRKRSMTEWQGPQPMRASLQMLFDGFAASRLGQSQAQSIAYLERHFAPTNGALVPPAFRVLGAWPLDEAMHWVCDGLQVDDDTAMTIVRRSDRVPLRTLVTLSLLQYVPGDVIIKTSAAKRSKEKQGSGSKTKIYVVKQGDTLGKIAAKQLGSAKRAADIKKLNPSIRDPKHLKVGLRLKLPAS
ncbi:LysM peptidoglycan-binding domain-containing protein [Kineosporia succinea]|uniref:LysM domain-containing protein n=1 Tax=Kineosporia succinea TaxID=84632 RepID=A0ABT9P9S6_9ACTN|nr:LysM domain-containing protein [Kineosporia succinea]MDP9829447.1 hypothetical protein [Kineosporia succinea]